MNESDERARGERGTGRRRPPLSDIVLALVLLLAQAGVLVAVAIGASRSPGEPSPFPAGPEALWVVVVALLIGAETIPLAFRRRRPLLVLGLVVGAAAALTVIAPSPIDVLALWIALYSVAAHTERPIAVRAGLASLAVLVVAIVVARDVGPVEAVFELGFLALGWMFGAYLGELRGRAARVRREQENETKRAIAEEQARIARELHDVLAHSISVMVVQAAAAEDVFDASPERARESLRSIETTGRHALDEVRRVLDVVRPSGGDGDGLAPQPSLSRLEELLARVRAAGLPVTLRIVGPKVDLPDGIDLSAYRIVQEALTNTLKHGTGATEATVELRYAAAEFGVEVCDDGAGPSPGAWRAGRGLIGMRERVAVYGGELTAGPGPNGGFRVVARFPVGSVSP